MFKTVINSQPPFHIPKDTQEIIDKYFKFFNSNVCKQNDFTDEITLELSDEKVNECYYPLPLSDFIEFILSVFNIFDKDDISSLKKARSEEEIIEIISKYIYRQYGQEASDVLKEIMDFIRTVLGGILHPLNLSLLGGYYDDSLKIKLYMKNIEILGYKLEEKSITVLFHEQFHASHYKEARLRGVNTLKSSSYLMKVIKESLASYFENESEKYLGFDSTNIPDSWYRNSVLFYPYSGAQYIENWEHFREIFEASFVGVEQAIDALFKNCPEIADLLKKYNEFLNNKNITIQKKTMDWETALELVFSVRCLPFETRKTYKETYIKRICEIFLDDFAKSLQPKGYQEFGYIDLFIHLDFKHRQKLNSLARAYIEKNRYTTSLSKKAINNYIVGINCFFEIDVFYDNTVPAIKYTGPCPNFISYVISQL